MDANTEYNTLVAIPRARRTDAQNARVRDLAAILAPQPAPVPKPCPRSSYEIRTIRQAEIALKRADRAATAEYGEEIMDGGGWVEIVRATLWDAAPDVRREMLRRNGLSD